MGQLFAKEISYFDSTEFLNAVKSGDTKKLKKQLNSTGVIVDYKYQGGRTAMHWAAYYGHLEVVKLLVKNGAKIDPKDADQRNPPLFFARQSNHQNVVDYLTELMKRKAENETPEEKYSNKDSCIICFEPRNGLFVLLPCGHTSLCEFCCIEIMHKDYFPKCPSCREAIKSYTKIYFQKHE